VFRSPRADEYDHLASDNDPPKSPTPSPTTGHPVTLTQTYALPLYVENHDNLNHTIWISVQTDKTEQYDQSVSVDAHVKKRLYTLTGNGSTYQIEAVMEKDSLNNNITLSGRGGTATIVVNGSGHLEYSGPSR